MVIFSGITSAKHKLTVLDFHRMAEAGILDEDARVELIEGELFDMAPIGSKHASIVDVLVEKLTLGAKGRYLVRAQGPLQIPLHNEPLPDVLLIKPRADRYRNALPQPTDVLLVIEVADSSLVRDRDVKIPIYAACAIPETCLVNIQRQVVTIYLQPSADGLSSRQRSCFGSGRTELPARLGHLSIGVVRLARRGDCTPLTPWMTWHCPSTSVGVAHGVNPGKFEGCSRLGGLGGSGGIFKWDASNRMVAQRSR